MSKEKSNREIRVKPKRVQVIVNPAPAMRVPLLGMLNQRFRKAEIEWDVALTHRTGDGKRLAEQAIADKVDVVVVYGGDGTVVEVASGMVGSDTPLLILAGGTGNLVAAELRLSPILERSLDLICNDNFATRKIDVGMMGDRPFVLRVGCGIETEVVQEATRELKNQFGKWAYVFAGIKTLQDAPEADYEIVIDGETVNARGMACVVANAGTVGVGRLMLAPTVDVDDGKLDVFFLKKTNIEAIFQLAGKMMGIHKLGERDPDAKLDASKLVNHWSVKTVEIRTDPILDVQVDGDVVAQTPLDIVARPKALRVVV